jgi:hypothetical protein
MRRTIRMGNERTGYKVPRVFAFATIAAMIVAAEAKPKLPRMTVTAKTDIVLMTKNVEKTKVYSIVTARVSDTVSAVLKRSFPKYTTEGDATSCSVIVVPLSSSLTKILERLDMAVKKITTQYIPERTVDVGWSERRAKRIVATEVTTNIRRAFNAYRVLSSD